MNRGETVLAYDQDHQTWRKARLQEHKPYYRRTGSLIADGWDIRWINPKECLSSEQIAADPAYSPSMGGWIPLSLIKPSDEQANGVQR